MEEGDEEQKINVLETRKLAQKILDVNKLD